MLVSGTAEFAAAPHRVWAFLVDPLRFAPCLPVPLERVDDRRYRAKLRVGSGFFALDVGVDVEVADTVPDQSGRIVARGGASGTSIEATATFQLGDGSKVGTTTVDWRLDIGLSGMFAGQAEQLIKAHAPEGIEKFLTCLGAQLEA